MEVKLGFGLEEIEFGMKLPQVEVLLGNFDEQLIDEDDSNKLIYVFNEKKISLSFYKDAESRLGYIETSNPSITFGGIQIFDKNIDFVKKEVFGKRIESWESDKLFSFTSHFNEEYWISLLSEYEKVTKLELGVPFLDNGKDYKWP